MSEYLDAVQARIEGATKGPWSVYRTRVGTYVTRPDLLGVAREWSLVWQDADAEFIANARVDVPRLLAAVRAVEALHVGSWECPNASHTAPDALCPGCSLTCTACGEELPCPTIRALTNALEGER